MEDSYKTIGETSQAEIKIRRSKFIATAFPSQSKEDAEARIAEVARDTGFMQRALPKFFDILMPGNHRELPENPSMTQFSRLIFMT